MSKRPGSNKENLEKTYKLFLRLGKKEFTRHGYANASTSRIVNASGMARGSLYYHFKDKQDLFRAVYNAVMEDIAKDLTKAIEAEADAWDGLLAACRLYFDICADDTRSRIFMIESQAALSYGERHAVIYHTIRPVLSEAIGRMVRDGYFDRKNKEMLLIIIFGALGEAGQIVSVLPNRKRVEDEFLKTFDWALTKLRGEHA